MTGEITGAPEDHFHVERDEDYERQARAEADYYDRPRMLEMDCEAPVTDAYLNERFTGDPNIPWYETIPTFGSFKRGCALGAGGARQRTRVLEQNADLHLTVYDISKDSLAEMAHDLTARFPGRVETAAIDLNFVEMEEESFDLIISSSCVHHLTNLEHVAFQINRALTPDGYFFLEDYVGEAKFQFPPEKKREFEEAFAAAKRRHRALRHWRVVWPSIDDWAYSPFEAMRSDETLDVFGKYLKEVDVRTAGAIVGLVMFVREPAPLGASESLWESARRQLAALKSLAFKDRLDGGAGRALLSEELLPLDREVSDDGSLRPTNAFAVYRKRGT